MPPRQFMTYRDAAGQARTITLEEAQRQPVVSPLELGMKPETTERIPLESATGYVDENARAGIAVGGRPDAEADFFAAEEVQIPEQSEEDFFKKESLPGALPAPIKEVSPLEEGIKAGMAEAKERAITGFGVAGSVLAGMGRGTLMTGQLPGLAVEKIAEKAFGKERIDAVKATMAKYGLPAPSDAMNALKNPTIGEQQIQLRRDLHLQDDLRQGGVPLAVAGDLAYRIEELATNLVIPLGVMGFGEKAIAKTGQLMPQFLDVVKRGAKEGAKWAGFTFATTPGDVQEKAEAAVHTAAFMMIPATASGISTPFLRKFIATAGIAGFNAPSYVNAVAQADDLAKAHGGSREDWLVSTLTPQVLMDGFFGVTAKGMKDIQSAWQKEMEKVAPKIAEQVKAAQEAPAERAPKAYETGQVTPEQDQQRVTREVISRKMDIPEEEADAIATEIMDNIAKRTATAKEQAAAQKIAGEMEAAGFGEQDVTPQPEAKVKAAQEAPAERAPKAYETGQVTPEQDQQRVTREVISRKMDIPEEEADAIATEIMDNIAKRTATAKEQAAAQKIAGEMEAAGFGEQDVTPQPEAKVKAAQPEPTAVVEPVPVPEGKEISFATGKPIERAKPVVEMTKEDAQKEYNEVTDRIDQIEKEAIGADQAVRSRLKQEHQELYERASKLHGVLSGRKPVLQPAPETPAKVEQKAGQIPAGEKPIEAVAKQPETPQEKPIQKAGVISEEAKPQAELSIEESIAQGKPVNIPNDASRVRVTYANGDTATVNAKDVDVLDIGEPIESVELLIKDSKGNDIPYKGEGQITVSKPKKPIQEGEIKGETPLFNKRRDIQAETRESREGGFVSLPEPSDRDVTKLRIKLQQTKAKFEATHGQSKEVNNALEQANANIAALDVRNRRWRITVSDMEGELVRQGLSKDQAATVVREVIHGEATAEELATAFKLKPDSAGIESLKEFETAREKAAKNLGVYLRQTGQESLARVIEENPNYVTRAYRLFEEKPNFLERLFGRKAFEPKPAARQRAVESIKAGFEERLGKIERIAQKMQKFKGEPSGLDVPKFMESEGPTLEGIPDQMSKSRVRRLLAVRDAYRKLKDIVEPVTVDPTTGKAQIKADIKNLNDAANSIIDELLNRPTRPGATGQAYTVNHLRKRVLGDVFRDLYGEIKEPINETMRTGEVQGRLLANQALMDTLVNLEGVSSNVALAEKGLTAQIPNNPKQYGALAGKYVDPNLAKLLSVGREPESALGKSYRTALSLMRQAAIFTHGSIFRNFSSSLTGMAMQTGEGTTPLYWAEAAKAVKLLAKYAAGDVQAMKDVEKYAKGRVFALGGTSAAQDIAAWSPGAARQLAAKVYTSADFAAQVASYEYQTKHLKKTHEQAIDWLNEYYQRAHTTPLAARAASRSLPFTDFVGYTAQSIRFAKNAAIHAYDEAKRGNIVPLIGFTIAHSIGLAHLTAQEELLRRGVMKLVRSRNDDAEDINVSTNAVLGNFMPLYWKATPKVTWRGKIGDKPVLRTVILGGQSAFPMDDLIGGIWSHIRNNPDMSAKEKFKTMLDQGFKQIFRFNMLYQAGIQATSGKSLEAGFPDMQSLADVYRAGPIETISDPAGRELLKKIALDLSSRFIPYGRKIMQVVSAAERENAGQKPKPGQKTYEEAVANLINLWRIETYDKERALHAINNRLRTVTGGEYIKTLTESKGAISAAVKAQAAQGAATPTQIEMSQAGIDRRVKMLEEMRKVIDQGRVAFKDLGVSNSDLVPQINVEGLSKKEQYYIMGFSKEIPKYIPKRK